MTDLVSEARQGLETAVFQESCATCDAYHPTKNSAGKTGQCRRLPPQAVVSGFILEQLPNGSTVMKAVGLDGVFPPTAPNLSCRSYRRKNTNGTSPITISLPTLGEAEVIPIADRRHATEEKDD